jgi:hypothetical protein
MIEKPNHLVDKEKQRPTVFLKETKKEKTFNSFIKAYLDIVGSDGKKLGSLELQLQFSWPQVRDIWHQTPANEITASPEEAMITTITIDKEDRGKGYGKSAYLQLLKLLDNTPLISGNTLTGGSGGENGSYQIWQSLTRDGLAVEIKKDGEVVSFISVPEGYKGTIEELEESYWERH